MPHFRVEYSRNLEEELDLPDLFDRLTEVAAGTGVFPLAGIRCRALPRDLYRIADGHPDNGFVHVELRVGAGRDLPTLRRAGETVFAALSNRMADLLARRPIALSFEIAEIHPDLNFKAGNIRDHMISRTHTAEGRRMTGKLNEHLRKLGPYRERICAGVLPHFIGGAPDPGSSGLTFENLTPIDNSILCDVSRGAAAEIDRAAKPPRRRSRTGARPPAERASRFCTESPI